MNRPYGITGGAAEESVRLHHIRQPFRLPPSPQGEGFGCGVGIGFRAINDRPYGIGRRGGGNKAKKK